MKWIEDWDAERALCDEEASEWSKPARIQRPHRSVGITIAGQVLVAPETLLYVCLLGNLTEFFPYPQAHLGPQLGD